MLGTGSNPRERDVVLSMKGSHLNRLREAVVGFGQSSGLTTPRWLLAGGPRLAGMATSHWLLCSRAPMPSRLQEASLHPFGSEARIWESLTS